MDVGQVREIEQVVADQQVVRVVVRVAALEAAPARIVEPVRVGDQRGVGFGRIAHPDPDPAMALDHREGAHAGIGRHGVLRRHFDALAGAVEQQAVIEAAHRVAFAPAARQGRAAMAAHVLEGHDLARLVAPQRQRQAEDRARQEAVLRHLLAPSSDVPGVLDEHGFLPIRYGAKPAARLLTCQLSRLGRTDDSTASSRVWPYKLWYAGGVGPR